MKPPCNESKCEHCALEAVTAERDSLKSQVQEMRKALRKISEATEGVPEQNCEIAHAVAEEALAGLLKEGE